jgi:hypothetical protein
LSITIPRDSDNPENNISKYLKAYKTIKEYVEYTTLG